MKMKRLIIILIFIFLTTGCWNYRELNEMAIVGSFGIDYNEKNEMFVVSAQIFNAKKTSTGGPSVSGDSSPVTVYEAEAKTVHEALRKITYKSPKKLYIGHLDIVIFGENFVRRGFINGVDFLFRDDESRKDFDILITKDVKASDILKVLTSSITIPSISVKNNINSNSTYKGTIVSISFDEFLSNYYTQGHEPTLPVITISGNVKESESIDSIKLSTPKTELVLNGMGVFKEDKLIGYLTEEESLGYTFTVSKIQNTVISFKCDDKNYGSMEIIDYKSKIGGEIKKEKPIIEINITAKGIISEYNCQLDLKDPKNIEKVSEMASNRIKEIVESVVSASQKKYNSDIFGFGEIFFRNNYKYWQKISKDWDNMFPNLEYKVNVDVELSNKGSIITSTKGGEKIGR